jgi:hypothetical protein
MVTSDPGHDLKASGFVTVEHYINVLLTNFWLPGCSNQRCGSPGRANLALMSSVDGIVISIPTDLVAELFCYTNDVAGAHSKSISFDTFFGLCVFKRCVKLGLSL